MRNFSIYIVASTEHERRDFVVRVVLVRGNDLLDVGTRRAAQERHLYPGIGIVLFKDFERVHPMAASQRVERTLLALALLRIDESSRTARLNPDRDPGLNRVLVERSDLGNRSHGSSIALSPALSNIYWWFAGLRLEPIVLLAGPPLRPLLLLLGSHSLVNDSADLLGPAMTHPPARLAFLPPLPALRMTDRALLFKSVRPAVSA